MWCSNHLSFFFTTNERLLCSFSKRVSPFAPSANPSEWSFLWETAVKQTPRANIALLFIPMCKHTHADRQANMCLQSKLKRRERWSALHGTHTRPPPEGQQLHSLVFSAACSCCFCMFVLLPGHRVCVYKVRASGDQIVRWHVYFGKSMFGLCASQLTRLAILVIIFCHADREHGPYINHNFVMSFTGEVWHVYNYYT